MHWDLPLQSEINLPSLRWRWPWKQSYQYSSVKSFYPLPQSQLFATSAQENRKRKYQPGLGISKSNMKKEEILPQSGESLTDIGGRGPLEKALSNLSSKQGYLQGAAQGCFQSDVEYLQGPRLHSALMFHLEQEGGSSLLYEMHPENKRERNSWQGLGLPLRAVAQRSLSRHKRPNFCLAWATVSKEELFVDNICCCRVMTLCLGVSWAAQQGWADTMMAAG